MGFSAHNCENLATFLSMLEAGPSKTPAGPGPLSGALSTADGSGGCLCMRANPPSLPVPILPTSSQQRKIYHPVSEAGKSRGGRTVSLAPGGRHLLSREWRDNDSLGRSRLQLHGRKPDGLESFQNLGFSGGFGLFLSGRLKERLSCFSQDQCFQHFKKLSPWGTKTNKPKKQNWLERACNGCLTTRRACQFIPEKWYKSGGA